MSENLLMEFLTEAHEHLDNIENDILKLESQGKNFEIGLVNHLFRAMHSIKGGSSFLKLTAIINLAHSLENIIDKIRDKKLVPNEKTTEVLLNGIDKLTLLLDRHDDSINIDTTSELSALQQLLHSPIIKPAVNTNKAENDKKCKEPEKKIKKNVTDRKIDNTKNNENSLKTPSANSSQAIHDGQFVYDITLDLVKECDQKNRSLYQFFHDSQILGNISNIHWKLEPVKKKFKELT